MIKSILVTPAPAPVMPSHINLNVVYVVTRGDGKTRVFDDLCQLPVSNAMWGPLESHKLNTPNDILIPVDIFTAVRLGLITFEELELPEGFRALLNIIK